MKKEIQEAETHNNNVLGVLIGVLIGSLAGSLTMLLMAPQSGRKTRKLIQEKGIELRDQTGNMLEDAFAQLSLEGRKLSREGRHKAKQIFQKSQKLVEAQLENVSDAAKAGKKALLNA